jgi:hypothetical protein
MQLLSPAGGVSVGHAQGFRTAALEIRRTFHAHQFHPLLEEYLRALSEDPLTYKENDTLIALL